MSPPPLPHTPNPLSSSLLLLRTRDISSTANDAKNTLSSWDACMSKTYCKYPVIVAIVVASLILLSILVCISRCLCCGAECCFGCFRCCNACCPSPRRSRRDYQQAPQQPWSAPPPQYHEPMMYGANGSGYRGGTAAGAPGAGPAPWQPQPQPQFARYDTISSRGDTGGGVGKGKKGAAARSNPADDRLPAMPSYATAQSHQVEDTSEPAAGEDARDGIPLREQQRQPMLPAVGTEDLKGEGGGSANPTALNGGFGNSPTTHQPKPLNAAAAAPAPILTSQHSSQRQANPPFPPPHSPVSPLENQTRSPTYPSAAVAGAAYRSPSSHTPRPYPQQQQQQPYAPASTSPVASSVYSAYPPPSYHTRAPPIPSRQTTTGTYASDYSRAQTPSAATPTPAVGAAAAAGPPTRHNTTGTYASSYSTRYEPSTSASPPPPLPSQLQPAPGLYSAYPAQQTRYTPYSAYNPSQTAQAQARNQNQNQNQTQNAQAQGQGQGQGHVLGELDGGQNTWGEAPAPGSGSGAQVERKPVKGTWREV